MLYMATGKIAQHFLAAVGLAPSWQWGPPSKEDAEQRGGVPPPRDGASSSSLHHDTPQGEGEADCCLTYLPAGAKPSRGAHLQDEGNLNCI